MTVLQAVAGVGCGLVAGLLFAFSAGIMTALGRLPAERGAAAMQAINVAVLNPLFLGVFLGSAAVCAALVVATAVTGAPAGPAIGAGMFLVGTLGVTVAVNVPMNGALATVDAGTAAGSAVWARYRVRWTRWNHVRTVAAVGATVVLCS